MYGSCFDWFIIGSESGTACVLHAHVSRIPVSCCNTNLVSVAGGVSSNGCIELTRARNLVRASLSVPLSSVISEVFSYLKKALSTSNCTSFSSLCFIWAGSASSWAAGPRCILPSAWTLLSLPFFMSHLVKSSPLLLTPNCFGKKYLIRLGSLRKTWRIEDVQ